MRNSWHRIKGAFWTVTVISFFLLFSETHSQVRVYVGMPDGSTYDLPDSGMVTMPVWIRVPARINAEIVLTASYPVTQWLGGYYYIDGANHFSINDSLTMTMVFHVSDFPDTQFLMADLWFYVYADPDDIGEQFDSIERLYSVFHDLNGQPIFGTVTISPIRIVARTAANDPTFLPEDLAVTAYPNPFNSSVTISFNLPQEGKVSVSIYDITGRMVQSFEQRVLRAGDNSLVWDATDDNGSLLSSGVYFYRIIYDDQTVTTKITLLR